MVHLHVHTKFSIGDALPSSYELAQRMGGGSLAITDHDSMSGIVEHHHACKKNNVKPIYGSEITTDTNNRLTLLAENQDGLLNLYKLMTVEKNYDNLNKYSKGIIAMSGDLMGAIPLSILRKNKADFKKHYGALESIYGSNFYFEEINHGIKEHYIIADFFNKFSKKTNTKIATTNDVHYLDREDALLHAVLLCSSLKKDVGNMYHVNKEAYLKDVSNDVSKEIAERCNVRLNLSNPMMPDFPIPAGYPHEFSYLKSLSKEGLIKKNLTSKVYIDRLKYELKVIDSMGFCGYFLIVWDFILWARRNNIPVGPGRGSGAGSLTAYCLGITDIDPIRYGLLFERFLNPDRVSLPDFDIDFSKDRRKEVISYVSGKYGNDYVAQIATMSGLKPRAAWKSAARAYGVEFSESNIISSKLPSAADVDSMKISLNKIMDDKLHINDEYSEYRDMEKYIKKYPEVFRTARNLEGAYKEMGKHAAGVLISKYPISHSIPVWSPETFPGNSELSGIISQLQYTDAEQMGMVKFDFLGLVELDVIQYAIELIKQDYNIDIDLSEIELTDDPKTFEMISDGNTQGMFQAQSDGFSKFMMRLRPSTFNDLIAGVALYRPGPRDMGMDEEYADRKNGTSPVVFLHPDLESVLHDTYGIIIYQEQVMEVVRTLSGYSLGEADIMRRAMGKKKKEEMDIQFKKFISGAGDRYESDVIHEIWNQIETFARYGFNKSHAAVYAKIMYQTAWLKANYPEALLAAQMEKRSDDADHVATFRKNAKQMGVEVIDFNINTSAAKFSIKNKQIRMGLKSIKGISESASTQIEANQPYDNFTDFIKRGCKGVSRSQVDALIKVGAMDSFSDGDFIKDRKIWLAHVDIFLKSSKKDTSNGLQFGLFPDDEYGFSLPPVDFDLEEMIRLEYESSGMYISQHPSEIFRKKIKSIGGICLSEINSCDQQYLVCAVVRDRRDIFTAKGDLMSFVLIEDETGELSASIFPSNTSALKEIEVGFPYFFRIQTSLYKGEISLSIEDHKRAKL
jgi:DNA polymerase-3 subunit alpha